MTISEVKSVYIQSKLTSVQGFLKLSRLDRVNMYVQALTFAHNIKLVTCKVYSTELFLYIINGAAVSSVYSNRVPTVGRITNTISVTYHLPANFELHQISGGGINPNYPPLWICAWVLLADDFIFFLDHLEEFCVLLYYVF